MQITKNTNATSPGPPDWFTGAAFVDTIATATRPRDWRRQPSTSPPVLALLGTRTPSGRRFMSPRASAYASAAEDRSKRSVPETPSTSSPLRITGTERHLTAS